MEFAAGQIHSRQQAIFLTPLKSVDGALEQEYLKGELSGITLFSQFVDIRIEALAEEINERLREEEEKRNARSNATDTGNFDDNVEPNTD